MFDEPPDVTEIKAVLKQASQDIRKANGETELSREGIMREISKDFSEIITESDLKKIDPIEKVETKKKKKVVKPKTTKKSTKKKKKVVKPKTTKKSTEKKSPKKGKRKRTRKK